MIGALLLVAPASAQSRYFSGKRFERQLDSPASIFWSDVPLSDAISNLSQTRRLAIWLDRRCDPNQLVSFGANLARLRDCLWKLSEEQEELDVAWVGDVIYVAPPNAANRLATVNAVHQQMLARLPGSQRGKWRQSKSMVWPKLTSPIQLVDQLEAELGMPIIGKAKVSHDLWPARQLPSIPLYQRLELLLAGFDLTFVFDEQGVAKIVEMPDSPRVTQSHKIPKPRLADVQAVLERFPLAKLQASELSASWFVHQLVLRTVTPPPTKRDLDRIRYTLRAENQTLGTFVRSLCKQLDLECDFNGVEHEKLEARVSFEVKQADIRTLFEEILKPAGLEFTLDGDKLMVTRADDDSS